MASHAFDLSWMDGRCISDVRFSEPSQWVFAFEPGIGIETDSPWRLLQDGRVAISSADHLQQYGLPAPLDAAGIAADLLGLRRLTRVEVRAGTADLFLDFTAGLRLEVLPFSSGYESWALTTPDGLQAIAQGGGSVVVGKAGA